MNWFISQKTSEMLIIKINQIDSHRTFSTHAIIQTSVWKYINTCFQDSTPALLSACFLFSPLSAEIPLVVRSISSEAKHISYRMNCSFFWVTWNEFESRRRSHHNNNNTITASLYSRFHITLLGILTNKFYTMTEKVHLWLCFRSHTDQVRKTSNNDALDGELGAFGLGGRTRSLAAISVEIRSLASALVAWHLADLNAGATTTGCRGTDVIGPSLDLAKRDHGFIKRKQREQSEFRFYF